MRIRDIQQFLSKFTDGQKGTAVSDCQVFIEMQDGTLAQNKKMELQESRIIGKTNGAAGRGVAWGGVAHTARHSTVPQKLKKRNQHMERLLL